MKPLGVNKWKDCHNTLSCDISMWSRYLSLYKNLIICFTTIYHITVFSEYCLYSQWETADIMYDVIHIAQSLLHPDMQRNLISPIMNRANVHLKKCPTCMPIILHQRFLWYPYQIIDFNVIICYQLLFTSPWWMNVSMHSSWTWHCYWFRTFDTAYKKTFKKSNHKAALTYWPVVTPYCITELDQHWFR